MAMHPALLEAIGQLDAAAGSLGALNQPEHDKAIVGAVVGLSRFYLHTDAMTGKYDPAPIYLDNKRVVFGLIPAAVAPLVGFLERRSAEFAAWIGAKDGSLLLLDTDRLPPTEVAVWAGWVKRIAFYRQQLDAALAVGANVPSEVLWSTVTAPLVQGIYPAAFAGQFASWGIANPAVPQKPDFTTPLTTVFVTAIYLAELDNLQLWLLEWATDVAVWRNNMESALLAWFDRALKAAGDAVGAVGRFFVGAAIVAVIGVGGWKLLNRGRGKK